MDDEKKYSIVGKVEIGTDEYRDLIEGLAEAKGRYENEQHKGWELSTKVSNLQRDLDSAKNELAKYKEFVNGDEAVKEKMKSYFLTKKLNEMGEN